MNGPSRVSQSSPVSVSSLVSRMDNRRRSNEQAERPHLTPLPSEGPGKVHHTDSNHSQARDASRDTTYTGQQGQSTRKHNRRSKKHKSKPPYLQGNISSTSIDSTTLLDHRGQEESLSKSVMTSDDLQRRFHPRVSNAMSHTVHARQTTTRRRTTSSSLTSGTSGSTRSSGDERDETAQLLPSQQRTSHPPTQQHQPSSPVRSTNSPTTTFSERYDPWRRSPPYSERSQLLGDSRQPSYESIPKELGTTSAHPKKSPSVPVAHKHGSRSELTMQLNGTAASGDRVSIPVAGRVEAAFEPPHDVHITIDEDGTTGSPSKMEILPATFSSSSTADYIGESQRRQFNPPGQERRLSRVSSHLSHIDDNDVRQRRGTISKAEEDVCFPPPSIEDNHTEALSPTSDDDGHETSDNDRMIVEDQEHRHIHAPDFAVLEDWAAMERKELDGGSENSYGFDTPRDTRPSQPNTNYVRARKASVPGRGAANGTPLYGPGAKAYEDHARQARFSYFTDELDATVHSQYISTLARDGMDFQNMFSNAGSTWWLDVDSPTDSEMRMIAKTFGIHPLTTEDICTQEAREKVELFRRYYLVSFRSFEHDKSNEEYLEPQNFYMIVFRDGILTFHYGSMAHPANVRRRIRQLKDYIHVTADWICYALIDDITDAFGPLIQAIEEEVDTIDENVLVPEGGDQSIMLRRYYFISI